MKRGDKVEVTWTDIQTIQGSWQATEGLNKTIDLLYDESLRSCGYFYVETDEYLVIYQSTAPDDCISEITMIPKGVIKGVRLLKCQMT